MPAAARSTLAIGGKTLSISNVDKVLWPEDGYTKGQLIAYYRSVAPWLLPHLRDRPLTLQRYPDGIRGPSFFEKQKPRGTPDWVPSAAIPSYGEKRLTIDYVVCNDEASLTYCANLAAIVLHIWTSRVKTLDQPDFVFFDLDPGEGCGTKTLARVALGLRDLLAEVGLPTLVKTSGGSGIHVVVPLKPLYDYDHAKTFAEIVARQLAHRFSQETTLERSVKRRPKGRVYLDYVQVGRGKTLVPPFGVRARERAPVSMTLDWSEIEDLARKRSREPGAEFTRWTMKNALARIKQTGDLWAPPLWKEQRLEPALKKARGLWEM